MRRPNAGDAAAIWRLVRYCRTLDRNSSYAYLLVCTDFAQTSVVAESAGRILGFLCGYRPPSRPESIFVWQVGVAPEARRDGAAAAMLEELISRDVCRDTRFLEATVTESNVASQALFERFAARHGARVEREPCFDVDLFPEPDHEAETRLRIGPLYR